MIKKIIKIVIDDIRFILSSFSKEGWGPTLKLLHSHDAPPFAQFVKYGICGVAAVIVQTSIVIWLNNSYLPAYSEGLDPAVVQKNIIFANLVAFPFANVTAYVLNVLWVFTPGRHSKFREFAMFTGVALFATTVALFGGPFLVEFAIREFGFGQKSAGALAQSGFTVTSALVNFVCRKLFIFLK